MFRKEGKMWGEYYVSVRIIVSCSRVKMFSEVKME